MPTLTSRDGIAIAYDAVGAGPPVILVDGALGFRAFGGSPQLATLLAPGYTAYCYDRRGRGDSGDIQPYRLEREIEDIDALIETAGGKAALYGISSGGALAAAIPHARRLTLEGQHHEVDSNVLGPILLSFLTEQSY